ncbi:MAG: hypothetical protein IPN76_33960 [Saprospiraceae bacterium]|jgi:hypothetical protein|nr:hypothetical protein [Saprospiraceae bacterium]
MKNLIFCVMTTSLLLLAVPAQLKAVTSDENPVAADSAANVALVNTLTIRLDEIASIDRAKLRPTERRELRKEVRSINKQLKAANSGGVYISVGALLIVIILLILLL